MRNKEQYVNMILKMFAKMEEKPGCGVTKSQLMGMVKDQEMQNFANNLDIQEVDLTMFFDILTSHGKRPVDLDTFVVGCIKLRGTAKSVDMVELGRDFRAFHKEHEFFRNDCTQQFSQQNGLLRLLVREIHRK